MSQRINEIYIVRTDRKVISIQIEDDRAYLFCFRSFREFRPQLFLKALALLKERITESDMEIAHNLLTNFDNFVLMGYPPSILESLVDKTFNHKFAYAIIGR